MKTRLVPGFALVIPVAWGVIFLESAFFSLRDGDALAAATDFVIGLGAPLGCALIWKNRPVGIWLAAISLFAIAAKLCPRSFEEPDMRTMPPALLLAAWGLLLIWTGRRLSNSK